jgi:GNAT superfamily N-acetyltransferase
MIIHQTEFLSAKQFTEISALWNEEYPIQLKDRLALLLDNNTKTTHYFGLDESGKIIAWSVLFEKEQDLRFSIIVSRKHQKQGLGSALLTEMKKEDLVFSGWVIDHDLDLRSDGSNYASPLNFYLKNAFSIDESCRLNSEMIKAVLVRYQPVK